jgi:anti-sigma regulatory factor (Ser/Thr protein kinase)
MLMGQLRTALHAYALIEQEPARVLELVDKFVASLDPEVMATVAYAVVDGESGMVHYASAGHLPPVFISPEGVARVVEVAVAPPIGAFAYKHSPQHELSLRPGETLLLYTDGLVERPRVPLPTGIGELVDAVEGARTPEDACLLAMDRLVPRQGPRDDVAVIAVENDPIPAVLELELAAHPKVLMTVRQMLARWLRTQNLDREVEAEITIAASEASANAIEHAYGPGQGTFSVRVERTADAVEVRVTDSGSWRAPRGEQRGRGLKIMKAAMDTVEIARADRGTNIVMRRKLGRA